MKRILAIGALVFLGFIPGANAQQFTDWLTFENLGPELNSIATDSCVAITKNGMNLIFSSTRAGGLGNRDLYMSKRESRNGLWGIPAPLTMLNTAGFNSCPALSPDEHSLYFSSPGSCGGNDIWVSNWHDRRNDSSGWRWEEPVNLGCAPDFINSTAGDQMPTLFEDEEGRLVMYFARSGDLYQSVMSDDGTFGPSTAISELNTASSEGGITVRRDGLEAFFVSNRPGSDGGDPDFWTVTRTSTADPWSNPVWVSSLWNTAWPQGRIALSFDGSELYFTAWVDVADGPGYDIYVAKRERVHGEE